MSSHVCMKTYATQMFCFLNKLIIFCVHIPGQDEITNLAVYYEGFSCCFTCVCVVQECVLQPLVI